MDRGVYRMDIPATTVGVLFELSADGFEVKGYAFAGYKVRASRQALSATPRILEELWK